MKTGVLLLNFGEPESATIEEVVPFLERIFLQNAGLMGPAEPSEVRARSRRLAEDRAPGLIEEYEEIGGSPLHSQSREQAAALQDELRARGVDALVGLGMQFTEPTIADAVAQLRQQGVEQVIGIPVYPLSGPSTSVAALREMDEAVDRGGGGVRIRQVTGWHRHPAYLKLRAEAIRAVCGANDVSFENPRTRLVFSAHGTPLKYIEEGSRYDEYVREFCANLAAEVGAPDYLIGYQNHANRPGVRWTQPDVDRVIAEVDADRVVVDAVSFMHEQSEKLAELDHELREEAEARGLQFHRVPIPYLSREFIELLADLVEVAGADDVETGRVSAGSGIEFPLRRCVCKAGAFSFCTNGA
jgi:protoporphyrin/coproporphyrin ferrochelatase